MEDQGEDLPEKAVDPTTLSLLRLGSTILWWVFYPIAISLYYIFYYLAIAIVFVLDLLYRPLEFILLPVVYLLQFIWACFLAPFQFLAKFETLYIYLGIAALVGITGGLVVSFISGALQNTLGLDAAVEPQGRTAKEYRREKRKQKSKAEPNLLSSHHSSSNYVNLSDGMRKGNRGRGLVAQTIMEEMDSDY